MHSYKETNICLGPLESTQLPFCVRATHFQC